MTKGQDRCSKKCKSFHLGGSLRLPRHGSWPNSSGSTFLGQYRVGSTKVGTDSTGSTTLTRDYDAFGNFIGVTGASCLPWGFAGTSGYWEENESSLPQVGHRYYDPSTGRFLTRDRQGRKELIRALRQ